jgi:acyl-CoA synthetase (AMP-forming)/AMP-acid ligase II
MILDHPERAERDLSSLRLAVTGAADVPVALVERMRRELSFETVLTAYGLTEAVVATMCRPGDPPEVVSATSGRAAAGFEVKIGRSDEILLRGPNLMLGYLDDPEATAAAIDGDGWLHTGDAGRLDAAGYLTITGRLKDMYICGGFNVYPAEVEQVLARLDGVAESAVIGVAEPRLGEVGQAFVVARPGFVLAEADVLAFCRERLANYKVPRRVEFRDALPRNPSGKVLKRQLREELREESLDGRRGSLRAARPRRADHAEPAAVRQRAELRDDVRARRGVRPGGERRHRRGAGAGRGGRPLLRRARHRHAGAGSGHVVRP